MYKVTPTMYVKFYIGQKRHQLDLLRLKPGGRRSEKTKLGVGADSKCLL